MLQKSKQRKANGCRMDVCILFAPFDLLNYPARVKTGGGMSGICDGR
jgi:hypothetical protein